MDNKNFGTGNTNWAPPTTNQSTFGRLQELPGANTSMLLGIFGLVLSLCLGCGIVGFILSIIAFTKGKKGEDLFDANPMQYSESSYKQAKAGKVLGLIGLILGIIVIIIFIIFIVLFGIAGLTGNLD